MEKIVKIDARIKELKESIGAQIEKFKLQREVLVYLYQKELQNKCGHPIIMEFETDDYPEDDHRPNRACVVCGFEEERGRCVVLRDNKNVIKIDENAKEFY